ncbi:MAG: electron transport complex subunit E [Tissierellia bacterium]|nr:electron transport complex subunit E [Tissierellia bacterium]
MKISNLTKGIIKENPTFVQLLGMCPTLAVTTSMENGLGMGLATTAVLALSNMLISLVRKAVPNKIRIPIFVVIIATFVTVVEMFMEAYMGALYSALGIFIPLIVVNCIILARAEAFAALNGPIDSLFDGIGMGLGFTLSLSILGLVRELLGTGKLVLFGTTLLNLPIPSTIALILPPGAFLVLGLLIALKNAYTIRKEA